MRERLIGPEIYDMLSKYDLIGVGVMLSPNPVGQVGLSMNRRCERHVMVWYGMVWYGMVWYGMVWYGMVWYGMVRYGMIWYGMVWYGMVWYGMVRHNGMVWYGKSELPQGTAVYSGENLRSV